MLSRCLAVLGGVILLFSFPAAGAAGDDDRAERAAREFLVRAWDGASGGGPSFEEMLRNMRRVRCLRLQGIALKSVSAAGETAVAEADVATDGDVIPLRVHLRRGGGRWRVSAIDLLDEELADQLIAARPEDAARLLAQHAERLTPHFFRVLDRRVGKLTVDAPTEARTLAAVELERKIALAMNDPAAEALSLTKQGDLTLSRGDLDAAIALQREAVAVAEAAGDRYAAAAAWSRLAGAMTRRDLQSPEVEDAYRRTLAYGEQVEDPQPAIGALDMLASLASIRGDLVAARRFLMRIAPLVEDTSDVVDDVYLNMGLALLYSQQDDRELALHHLRRCLALMGTGHPFLRAQVLLRVADVLMADDSLDEAAAALAEARALSPPSSVIHAFLLERAGIIRARRGDVGEAECLLREAAARYAERGFHYGPALDELTPALVRAKDYRAVLRLSLEQVPYVEERSPITAAKALTAAAEAYAALGDRDRAAAILDEAIAAREALHERVAGAEEQKIRSTASTAAAYELRAKLATGAGDVADALAFVERGRGRVLYEIIGGGRSARGAAEDEELRAAEARLSRLAADLSRAETARDPAAAVLRARLEEGRRDHRSLMDGLRERSERRAAAIRPLDAASLDEVLRALPAGMTAVEYVVRDNEVEAFLVRAAGGPRPVVEHFAIPIRRDELERRVGAFARMIAAGDLRYRAAARSLYRLLIAPLEKRLAGAEALCVVPDEVLWRLPFGALVDGEGQFLIERWALDYSPSLTLYAAIAARPRDASSREPQVLLVANPALSRETRQSLQGLYRVMDLGALPDAEREAAAVRRLYRPGNCLVLARGEATESRVKSAIAGKGTVHFATHGILDDRHPMYSRLVLARGDGADDGSLEAWEVARLDVPADLVVLSACDTAGETIAPGEGVVGMAWSFFVAGARSAVATQWKVDSSSAAALMIDFHRALRARAEEPALRKAQALRQAQLQLIGDPRTRHPYHWAAFILLGDAS